jgi:hypothetical protein
MLLFLSVPFSAITKSGFASLASGREEVSFSFVRLTEREEGAYLSFARSAWQAGNFADSRKIEIPIELPEIDSGFSGVNQPMLSETPCEELEYRYLFYARSSAAPAPTAIAPRIEAAARAEKPFSEDELKKLPE